MVAKAHLEVAYRTDETMVHLGEELGASLVVMGSCGRRGGIGGVSLGVRLLVVSIGLIRERHQPARR